MNKKGNSLLANNFLKYLRSTFWDDIDSNCFEVNVHECESKLDIPDRLSDVVSERSLKVISKKNPNRIVLAHLNINSLRNKFDILTDQISGDVDVMVISETKLDYFFPESQFRINPRKHLLLNYISGKSNGFLAIHIILTKATSQTIYNV